MKNMYVIVERTEQTQLKKISELEGQIKELFWKEGGKNKEKHKIETKR